jgi:RecB family exonuclease
MIIGEIIHKTLELFRKQPENILELFETEFPIEKWSEIFKHLHPRQQQVERERIKAILEKYAAWDNERSKNSRSKTIGLEEKIEYQLGNTTIVGVIDRVDTLPDSSTLIIDYKTGQLPPLSLRELTEGYLPQAWIYAFLYQELKKATVIGTEYQQVITTKTKGIYAETHTDLLNISSRQIMSSDTFKKALENTKQKLIQVLQDIHGAKFYGFARHCENICEYTAVCRMTYERS